MNTSRLDVKKTYKLYIGGNFVRSESGRYHPARSATGMHLDNVCHASRKDFREAVVVARAAADGWAGKSPACAGKFSTAPPRCCRTASANSWPKSRARLACDPPRQKPR